MTGRGTARARRHWAGWLVLVLLGSFAIAAGAHALARPAAPPDPRVEPGDRVVVIEDGFAARTAVTVGLAGERLLGTVDADAHGRVAYRFAVPAGIGAGAHALVFAGRPVHLARNRHGGNLLVAAPLVRTWRFRVVSGGPSGGSSGVSSGGTSAPGSTGHPGHPGSSGAEGAGAGHEGGTSTTGSDVLAALAVGLLALVAGGGFVRAARRRPRRG